MARGLAHFFFFALRLTARDSPLLVGMSFTCVGGPANAPRNIFCSRLLVPMTDPNPDPPAILLQLQELGRLVTYWNALDWQAKWILANLAPNKLTAGMMSADLSIGTVISTARM